MSPHPRPPGSQLKGASALSELPPNSLCAELPQCCPLGQQGRLPWPPRRVRAGPSHPSSMTPLPWAPPIPLTTFETILTDCVLSLPISQRQLQVKLEGLVSCSFYPGLTGQQGYFDGNNWTSRQGLVPRKETPPSAPCHTPTNFLVGRTVSAEPGHTYRHTY